VFLRTPEHDIFIQKIEKFSREGAQPQSVSEHVIFILKIEKYGKGDPSRS